MFLFCNTGQEARLGMQDAGMRRRLRTLQYPAIPPDDVIEDFNTVRTHDPGFQTALLARLGEGCKQPRRQSWHPPPSASPEDVGEIGRFARRVVRGGDVLPVAEVWSAWCEHNDVDPNGATTVNGIPLQRLSRMLRDHVAGLPSPKQIRVGGRVFRGWRDWRLLTVEELEDQDILAGRPRSDTSSLVRAN